MLFTVKLDLEMRTTPRNLYSNADAAGDSFADGQAYLYTGKHSKVSLTFCYKLPVELWFCNKIGSDLK